MSEQYSKWQPHSYKPSASVSSSLWHQRVLYMDTSVAGCILAILYGYSSSTLLGNVGLHLRNHTMSQPTELTNFLHSLHLSVLFSSLFKLILLCWNCRNLNASYLSGQSPSSARPHSVLTQIPVRVTAYGRVHILHNLIDLSNTSLLRSDGTNINPVSFHNVPSAIIRPMWVWNKGM